MSFNLNCAYYPGAKPEKKHALNKQYALHSELHLLTPAYGMLYLVPLAHARNFIEKKKKNHSERDGSSSGNSLFAKVYYIPCLDLLS